MKAINRLYEILDIKGVKPTSFEKIIGLSSGYLSNQKKRNADMGETIMTKVIDYFNDVNPVWFVTGKGEMLLNTTISSAEHIQPTLISSEKLVYTYDNQEIPLYDISATAGCVELLQNPHDQIPIDMIKIPNLAKCDGAVFVRGDSMYPILKSGDIILYKTIPGLDTIIWGETYIVCYEVYGDYYTVVKYVKKSTNNEGNITLISQNEHHQPFEINLSQVKAMALVRASIRYNNM